MDNPDKKPVVQTAKEVVADAPAVRKPDVKEAPEPANKWRRILPVFALVAVVLGFGVVVGWMTSFHYAKTHEPRADVVKFEAMPRGGMLRERLMDDTNDTSGSAKVQVSGVVTQVGSDSFTIAGNGATKTIKTTGSTTYNTGSGKVAVNDSVVVSATQSGDTLTAVSVHVINN